jgi:hypothetical protein
MRRHCGWPATWIRMRELFDDHLLWLATSRLLVCLLALGRLYSMPYDELAWVVPQSYAGLGLDAPIHWGAKWLFGFSVPAYGAALLLVRWLAALCSLLAGVGLFTRVSLAGAWVTLFALESVTRQVC